jgi:hypothetical protein
MQNSQDSEKTMQNSQDSEKTMKFWRYWNKWSLKHSRKKCKIRLRNVQTPQK